MRHSLVLERTPIGHRANYARTVSSILGYPCAIGFSGPTLWNALTARHLVITTFESAPAIYLVLLLARALLWRRSTVIFTRAHVRSNTTSLASLLKSAGHGMMRRLPSVQRLSITPPGPNSDADSAIYIEDIEFWDLSPEVLAQKTETPLSSRAVAVARQRPIILLSGTLEHSKGLMFLFDLIEAQPELTGRFAFICAGAAHPAQRDSLSKLAGKVDLWEDRYLEDAEIISLYHQATAVWCCYAPSYDVSSGIFGRAIQFARPTIVRAGSIIDMLQDRLSDGLKLDYDDVEGSARTLMMWQPCPGTPASRYETGAERLRELIAAHATYGPETH